jgi:hypothetical protein
MATEFNTGGKVRPDNAARQPMNVPSEAPARRSWGMVGALAAIAVLVVIGLLFSMKDTGTTVSNAPAAATTGSANSPSNPPAAPGPQGQVESNSMR